MTAWRSADTRGPHRPRLVAALAGVALAAACGGSPATSTVGGSDPKLAALRATAALPACPTGVSAALPDLTLGCLSGGPNVALRTAGTGRPTLVNIWATWCGPCVREVPALVGFANQARGRVDVLGVLTEDEPRLALIFAHQFQMPYTSVLDPDGMVLRSFSPGPPATVFLDAAGKIVFVQRGEIRTPAILRTLVRDHLGVDVPLAP